jgi:hypothetical protein
MSMGIIETLQAEIQSLKERVTALEQIEKKRMYDEAYNDYLSGKFDEIIESSAKKREKEIRKSNAQLTRDDIIEMAKRDVAELERRMENYEIRSFSMYAQYFINREKRTVVALIRQSTNFPPLKDRPVSRGIAKCHPDDCFNAHIGRAIALRRALGLKVPDEYLNAPQPTEVRVGDIVESYSFKQPKRYIVVGTDKEVEEQDGRCHINSIIANNFPVKTKIIDDSRE